jgi:hypothetical protein
MSRFAATLTGLVSIPALTMGCGLDWTLPTNHFDGVEEHGYVSYWEKIGEADLGDGLVIPVNINFDSHREASSPYLGKGWMVALLESHVEPLDENNVKVIMPDGWNFYFQRDGNAETWHGNAGWKGETNNTVFTITAPCGWRIKFDGGKIQEIDSNKNRVLSYKYEGPVATEVDVDGKPFVRVDNNSTSGAAQDVVIGVQKVDITFAQRPRVMTKLTENLVTGFDPCLSQLAWGDGKKEKFNFDTDKSLNPTLAVDLGKSATLNFTWDAETRRILTDDCWTYHVTPGTGGEIYPTIARRDRNGATESWQIDLGIGQEITKHLDGMTVVRSWFTTGKLAGKVRKLQLLGSDGKVTAETTTSYNEDGQVIRQLTTGLPQKSFSYDHQGMLVEYSNDGIKFNNTYSAEGLLMKKTSVAGTILFGKNGSDAWNQAMAGLPSDVQAQLKSVAVNVTSSNLGGIVHAKFMNDAGKLLAERVGDSHMLEYKLNPLGQICTVTDNSKVCEQNVYGPDKRLEKRTEYNPETGKQTYIHEYQYDTKGNLRHEVIHDSDRGKDEAIDFTYDDLGRLASYSDSERGTETYHYERGGKNNITFSSINAANIQKEIK